LAYCVASSRLTIIVAEQATEAVLPQHVPPVITTCPFRRDESVIEPLVIALCMIVAQVLVDHTIQGTFTQYNHLIGCWCCWSQPATMAMSMWRIMGFLGVNVMP
jgi:hypothetical protein